MKTGLYSTKIVAYHILKVSHNNIFQAIYRQKIKPPQNKLGNCYLWDIDEIEQLAAVLNRTAEVAAFRKLPIRQIPEGICLEQ